VPAFVTTVGLFVNEPAAQVKAVLEQMPLDLLQFHGDENAAYCEAFRRPWIKAARVRPGLDLVEYAGRFSQRHGSYGHAAGCPCRGLWRWRQTFDWSLIPPGCLCPSYPVRRPGSRQCGRGGAQGRPWAVDVSSGVESAKGIKDVQKISAFIAGVRDADAGPAL
jgi:phosphoribosylanthranilate isomerase